jgi:hypothetical protein
VAHDIQERSRMDDGLVFAILFGLGIAGYMIFQVVTFRKKRAAVRE